MSTDDTLSRLRAEALKLTDTVSQHLHRALETADERIALPPNAAKALAALDEPLPETGCGAAAALESLLAYNAGAGANTNGPKCFHFVIGGSTPAALGADWIASAHDAVTYTWITSPVGVTMELQALRWLRELFELPADWSGLMVTGGTMANFVSLAAARQWWGEAQGVDVGEAGLAGLAPMPVLTSGFVHASSRKVLSMLGVGRGQMRTFARDAIGHLDAAAFEKDLQALDGKPAVVIVNAGEVNAGEFDPVEEMINIARRYNTWIHVDGAFGLFARISPRTEHWVRGVERADSVAVDGHKWLNVPYDVGFSFVRDQGLLARAFRYTADYLPPEDDPRPTLGAIGPESSRRARSFAVWATLKAYGRAGQRRIVEHCLDLAQHLAKRVDETPALERLADVPLNIVAFRYRPDDRPEAGLNQLNQRLGDAMLADGRFLVGTSKLGPRTILRPAFSNWRTRFEDVDEFVAVLLDVAKKLAK